MARRPNRSARDGRARAPVTAPIPWAVTSRAVATGVLTPCRCSTPDMAGTRAMNGEANRATMAMSSTAARQPGSDMAARAPITMRAQIPTVPPALIGLGNLTSVSATTTAANDAALMAKTTA